VLSVHDFFHEALAISAQNGQSLKKSPLSAGKIEMSSDKSQAKVEDSSTKQANCLFCSIHNKEINAPFIYEDDAAFAIRDINPQAPTHVLVIPRRHVDNVAKLEDKALMGALFSAAARVAGQENLSGGFRLVVNTGSDGGQTVNHLHIHVLGGRSMVWPPG